MSFYKIYNVKTTSALLSKVKPVSRQNMDIDFSTVVSVALKMVICFFNMLKEYMHTIIWGDEETQLATSLAFLAHKTKLNLDNPLLVGGLVNIMLFQIGKVFYLFTFTFTEYKKNAGYAK